ncbi:hypothetical protein RM697_02185 [Ichthyenterobacterium sp. W332]|uniref:Uncharacterized protein n=1 Tax=Microcosmobacter mediterraneus TaxID=3075607 RepID=A0ABU2YGY0_9FLAO|nr:hypothetical protein [Ichthyenterobacterium sp. W332]MDT0557439.1 hypothetical protein [Ichthyenterobacterium sp. W332]
MKSFIFLIFIVFSSISYCQDKEKPIYYQDIDESIISLEEFERKSSYNGIRNINLYFENDTAYFYKKFPSKRLGRLSPEQLKFLYHSIDEINTFKINRNNIIIIQYYPGYENKYPGNRLSKWNRYHKDYIRKLKKTNKFEFLWVYGNSEGIETHHTDRFKWLFDKNKNIQKLFFPFYIRYGSFAIVNQNGEFICVYGEYGKQTILEACKEIGYKIY